MAPEPGHQQIEAMMNGKEVTAHRPEARSLYQIQVIEEDKQVMYRWALGVRISQQAMAMIEGQEVKMYQVMSPLPNLKIEDQEITVHKGLVVGSWEFTLHHDLSQISRLKVVQESQEVT